MALTCVTHKCAIFDRGGVNRIGDLDGIVSVQWERQRDELTTAVVSVGASQSKDCSHVIALLAAGRHELVIWRGDIKVWEGPITHISYEGARTKITARDVCHYLDRMIMKGEYNNAYPHIGPVVDRVYRIIQAESARFEGQSPPIRVREYVEKHNHPNDAQTSSHTLRYHSSVYDHMDQLAARGGLDYCTVGRSIHLWDQRHPALGQTAPLSDDDFIGSPIITEYGLDLCTVAAMSDGKGNAAEVGVPDEYYGLVERVETAQDEETGEEWDEVNDKPPNEAELRSQAQRLLRTPPPLVVRVPDNSTLNPNGTLSINELVPGVFIPLQATISGRRVSQMQKLDNVTVKEEVSGDGPGATVSESIQVTLSPAPNPREDPEFEE